MVNNQNEVLALQEMESMDKHERAITITMSSQSCISAISAVTAVAWNSSISFGCGK